MKRKGLTIKINLTNRWLYTLIALGVLIAVGVGVYAAVDTTKAWHPASQVDFSSGITTTNLTTNKICLSGSCQISWPGATKAFGIYNVTSIGCGVFGAVSASSKCKTAVCKTVQGNCVYYIPGTSFCQTYSYTYTYYTCTGSCSSSSSATCSNTVLGYLIS